MLKHVLRAMIVGAFVFGIWQMGGSSVSAEVHNGNLHDCGDFDSQDEAQAHLNENPTDPDGLDADHDDVACENYDYHDDDCDSHDDCNGNYCDFHTCESDHYYGCSNPYYSGAPYNGAPVYYYGASGNPYFNGAGANPYSGQPGNPAYNPAVYGYPYYNGQVYPYSGSPNQYNECANGLNHSPGFNRPVALTMLVQNSTMPCGAETTVVARAVYPDGVGAPNRLFTFNSTAGTVFSNLLSDYAGYVQTKFVAPFSPGLVTIDAFVDGLKQSTVVKVECSAPAVPPLGVTYISPILGTISPPSTGDAGLASEDNGTSWALIAALVVLAAAPVATVAAVKVRK
jgi:hypothetical protein